ncbi:MAG: right-handed parallel beta-helix repeat-containing protein, partial [bacterium]|nr:right-handed parallel beta-helix repeat-containing protein [bacterium]
MKKLIMISMGLFLFLATNQIQARNYYVKTNGLNTSPGTNWTTAWKTINNTITNMASGDVVIVSNGIYNEEITVCSNQLTFRSLNKRQAVITGGTTGFDIQNCSGTVIDGFVIKKASQYGIRGSSTINNSRIVNNSIYSNPTAGIYISGGNTTANVILSNDIWGLNQTDGINIDNVDYNQIRFNQIHHNKTGGIVLSGTAKSNYITRNSFYSNDSWGILLGTGSSGCNFILTNEFWGYNQDNGIRISSTTRCIVMSNRLHNGNIGIYVVDSSTTNYIIKNQICLNQVDGIRLVNGPNNNYVLQNDIWSNSVSGIRINNGVKNVVRENRIWKNIQGIYLSSTEVSNYIVRNLIWTNTGYGIYLLSSATKNIIMSNDISRHPSYGIFMNGGDTNFICANRIHHNSLSGIFLNSTSLANN